MTIPEAVSLVLQAGSRDEENALYLLDMGKPVNIMELAKNMITLSGRKPGDDIEIKVTGLRPGEKLHEDLVYAKEKAERTEIPKLLISKQLNHLEIDELQEILLKLKASVQKRDQVAIIEYLKDTLKDYQCNNDGTTIKNSRALTGELLNLFMKIEAFEISNMHNLEIPRLPEVVELNAEEEAGEEVSSKEIEPEENEIVEDELDLFLESNDEEVNVEEEKEDSEEVAEEEPVEVIEPNLEEEKSDVDETKEPEKAEDVPEEEEIEEVAADTVVLLFGGDDLSDERRSEIAERWEALDPESGVNVVFATNDIADTINSAVKDHAIVFSTIFCELNSSAFQKLKEPLFEEDSESVLTFSGWREFHGEDYWDFEPLGNVDLLSAGCDIGFLQVLKVEAAKSALSKMTDRKVDGGWYLEFFNHLSEIGKFEKVPGKLYLVRDVPMEKRLMPFACRYYDSNVETLETAYKGLLESKELFDYFSNINETTAISEEVKSLTMIFEFKEDDENIDGIVSLLQVRDISLSVILLTGKLGERKLDVLSKLPVDDERLQVFDEEGISRWSALNWFGRNQSSDLIGVGDVRDSYPDDFGIRLAEFFKVNPSALASSPKLELHSGEKVMANPALSEFSLDGGMILVQAGIPFPIIFRTEFLKKIDAFPEDIFAGLDAAYGHLLFLGTKRRILRLDSCVVRRQLEAEEFMDTIFFNVETTNRARVEFLEFMKGQGTD